MPETLRFRVGLTHDVKLSKKAQRRQGELVVAGFLLPQQGPLMGGDFIKTVEQEGRANRLPR